MAATIAPILSLENDSSYDFTVSPDGKTEAVILLHSRMGIRIEYNLHRNALDLWISPQAGKSVACRDRNFSCRDDHTSIFDRIWLPEMGAKKFLRCHYDPFHSMLHFEGQTLHLASLLDKPVVLLWAEREEMVDFKSDKQDTILTRTPRLFAMRHPDRGRVFDFVAALGRGTGAFWHQPEVDTGRSTYARVVLAPRQLLVIGGELSKERVPALVRAVAARSVTDLIRANEKLIAKTLRPGTIVLRKLPKIQKLYDINKRHLLSVQDASGAVRAALKYVYYLIWSTDGAVTTTHMFQTGWRDYLRLWLEFLLANPTSQQSPPHGRFYGQLVNPRITKREEFGVLCAVWPAFMYWGLTGDKRFVSGRYLAVLEDAVNWLERYCHDPKMGGLGTFYHGGGSEDPFYGSNDFGWDAAVGCPLRRDCYAPRYNGRLIRRAYEFGMNLNMYNMYLMLSAVTSGAKATAYLRKAGGTEQFLRRLLTENVQAYYLLDNGRTVAVPFRDGERECGLLAVQSGSPAFFMPQFPRLFGARMATFSPLTTDAARGQMPCAVYGRLAGLDTEFVPETDIVRSLEATVDYHIQPSPYVPMPWTMVEVMGAKPGEYHDIRPQAFSAGPFQAAVTNLAVRTMPFGIALRASNTVAELRCFQYRDGYLDISYSGTGRIAQVLLNSRPLEYTLQNPDSRLRKGRNVVEVTQAPATPTAPTLVYSTVRLLDATANAGCIRYSVEGFCQNVLVFRDTVGDVRVSNQTGRSVTAFHTRIGRYLFVEFWGKDRFVAHVSRA